MEELLKEAEELIIAMGGCEEDVEQITDEIIASGYTTIEEVKFHLENHYT